MWGLKDNQPGEHFIQDSWAQNWHLAEILFAYMCKNVTWLKIFSRMNYMYFYKIWTMSHIIWWQSNLSTMAQIMACCWWHQINCWWHQAITGSWTEVDLSSKVFCSIHLRTENEQGMLEKITISKFFWFFLKIRMHLAGDNKIWWLCLVPTSTTRFASEVGYRIAKIWHGYTRKIFFMNNDI